MQTNIAKVTVGLSQVEEVPKEGGAVLTFGVADIDQARGKLEASDVRFDGPTRTIPGMVKLATFYDPDGNTLMFAQGLRNRAGHVLPGTTFSPNRTMTSWPLCRAVRSSFIARIRALLRIKASMIRTTRFPHADIG